jgi:hypothetical protein
MYLLTISTVVMLQAWYKGGNSLLEYHDHHPDMMREEFTGVRGLTVSQPF